MFDSVMVRFKGVKNKKSPFAITREVPFVTSYLEILRSVINDIDTDFFWFFAGFVDMSQIDIDYIPEQHERDQIHVWHTTKASGGYNKEGNVMLIPTKRFKDQMHNIDYLRDFKDINYHEEPKLYLDDIEKTFFSLSNPVSSYKADNLYYTWLINRNCDCKLPNFYPSFWEDEKMYTWGSTKDIMLVPGNKVISQFYDIDRSVHYEYDYDVKPMDIIFISYDEPNADENWNKLKEKFARAKRSHGVKGRTLAYHTAAHMSDTDYFFAVFPTIEISDSFDFKFQPDRMREACHYIFHCKNPVNGLEYGHRAVILYNKELCLSTNQPGLDFTLSQPHTVVPILCGTSNFNTTPEISWRVAFREVIKLCEMKPTIESRFRLKKWCQLGEGNNSQWVHKGALDAKEYYEANKHNKDALMLSYELSWLKERFQTTS